jgi:hypothetical protein
LLFQAAERAAREHRRDGLLVKAQKDATGFFIAQGMSAVAVDDARRDYANRFWKPVAG